MQDKEGDSEPIRILIETIIKKMLTLVCEKSFAKSKKIIFEFFLKFDGLRNYVTQVT